MVWVWIKPLIIFDAKSDADFHGDWCFSMKPLRVWMFCLLVWCIRYIDSYHLIPICLFCPGLWEVNWYSGNLTNIKHGFVFAPGRMARASIHQLHACVLRSSLYFYRSRDIFLVRLYFIVFHRISKKWILNEFLGFVDATFSDVRSLHCQVHGNGGDFLQC